MHGPLTLQHTWPPVPTELMPLLQAVASPWEQLAEGSRPILSTILASIQVFGTEAALPLPSKQCSPHSAIRSQVLGKADKERKQFVCPVFSPNITQVTL